MDKNKKNECIKIIHNVKSSEEEKIQACFKLMNIADTKSLNAIIYCLKNDKCPVVRHEAAFSLGETISNKSLKALKEVALIDKSEIVIHECLLAIGTIAKKKEKKFIERFLEHKNFIVRQTAKVALQRLNYEEKPYSGVENFKHLANN